MRNQPSILTHILFTSLVLVLPVVLILPAKADKSDMSCILATTTAVDIIKGRIDGVTKYEALRMYAYGRNSEELPKYMRSNEAPWVNLVTRAYQTPLGADDRANPDQAARRFAGYAWNACLFGDL